jgi:hypothetical protein
LTKTIEIFFSKWGTNHGGNDANIPNWFYYWEQGAAPISGFEYDPSKPWCGYYDKYWDKLYLDVNAPESSGSEGTNITLYNHYYHTGINSGPDGLISSYSSGDDYQVRSVPEPDTIAIIGGTTLETQCLAGDVAVETAEYGWVIHTGADGILNPNTIKSDYDTWFMYEYMGEEYHIQPGGAKPFATIVSWDDGDPNTTENDWLDSNTSNDDRIDLTDAVYKIFSMPAETTGIYMVAKTCTHESVHRMVYGYVCTNPNDDPPKYYYQTNDGDYVHDDYLEGTSPYNLMAEYYLCPHHPDTYNMKEYFFDEDDPYPYLYDHEFLAYMNQTSVNADPDYDWSNTDGAQWHK